MVSSSAPYGTLDVLTPHEVEAIVELEQDGLLLPMLDSTSPAPRRRWLMLALFASLSFSNATQWITYATIDATFRPLYRVSTFEYDLLSTIYAIVYVILAVPAAIVIERRGLRFSLVLAAAINLSAAAVRCFSAVPAGYAAALAGQTIGATAQALFLAAPPMISAIWFPPEQRATATALGVLANNVGIAITFALPAVTDSPEEVRAAMVAQTALCAAVFVAIVLLFRDAPPHPPSATSTSAHAPPTALETWHACRNRSFAVLVVTAGLGAGSLWCLSTVIARVLTAKDKRYPEYVDARARCPERPPHANVLTVVLVAASSCRAREC